MSSSDGAEYGTEEMRRYVRRLRGWRDRLAAAAGRIEKAKLPVEVWGVPNVHVGPTNPAYTKRKVVVRDAPPALALAKWGYESAHDAQHRRLRELVKIYAEAADALEAAADNYDRADGRDPGR